MRCLIAQATDHKTQEPSESRSFEGAGTIYNNRTIVSYRGNFRDLKKNYPLETFFYSFFDHERLYSERKADRKSGCSYDKRMIV